MIKQTCLIFWVFATFLEWFEDVASKKQWSLSVPQKIMEVATRNDHVGDISQTSLLYLSDRVVVSTLNPIVMLVTSHKPI